LSIASGERILRPGTSGTAQAATLGNFPRRAEILAASEALRIGQRFGLEAATLLDAYLSFVILALLDPCAPLSARETGGECLPFETRSFFSPAVR
jgi:hypothetical protein